MDQKLGIAVILLAAAYFYPWYGPSSSEVKLLQEGWETLLKDTNASSSDVLVGINANVDLILRALPLMQSLYQKYPDDVTAPKARELATLDSLQDLIDVFTLYFRRGNAAERNFLSRGKFDKVISAAEGLQKEWSVGGNGALMARSIVNRFSDVKVRFIGPVGPRLAQLLPDAVLVPEDSRRQTDETHVILEYSVGEEWQDHKAIIATRFITSYDEANSQADSVERFFDAVNDQRNRPDLVVFSGLHLLDSLPESAWAPRLESVLSGLGRRGPSAAPFHLEIASMANERFITKLLDEVLPLVTSVGLNEQELSVLSAVGGGPHADLAQSLQGPPDVHKVGDMLQWLLTRTPGSHLSRVHFHCLSYHIIAATEARWSQLDVAVAAGARVAGLQACDTDRFSESKFFLRSPLVNNPETRLFSDSKHFRLRTSLPVHVEQRGDLVFAFSPVLVCRKPLKTVGLGDAISSTGLLYSQYNRT